MTPVEFEQKYHQVRVPFQRQGGFAGSRLVDVHIYCQTGPAVVLREKDALVRHVDQEVRGAGGLRMIDVERNHRMMISRAFYGKGSPDDCAIALKHALRYGRTHPDRLQQYCDQVGKIGIDCSGFVNNYFRAIGKVTHDRNIAQYAHGRARDDLASMQTGDVLIWTNSHGHIHTHPRAHIAILNSAPDRQGHAVVVESAHSLGGLTHSTYTFTQVARNLFHVQRPSGTSHVRVYAVS
jgi:hypothetical protein